MSALLTSDPISPPTIHFERLKGYIAEALEYAGGTHTLEDVRRGLETGHFQMWPTPTSVVITEIQQYPQAKILHFFLAAGNLDELKPLHPIILEWARSIGCTKASFLGRHGWQRTFMTREEGWAAPLSYYTKDL